jgi:hypothetical protein
MFSSSGKPIPLKNYKLESFSNNFFGFYRSNIYFITDKKYQFLGKKYLLSRVSIAIYHNVSNDDSVLMSRVSSACIMGMILKTTKKTNLFNRYPH